MCKGIYTTVLAKHVVIQYVFHIKRRVVKLRYHLQLTVWWNNNLLSQSYLFEPLFICFYGYLFRSMHLHISIISSHPKNILVHWRSVKNEIFNLLTRKWICFIINLFKVVCISNKHVLKRLSIEVHKMLNSQQKLLLSVQGIVKLFQS